ncbi:hypothetical protein QTO34_015298 [Cnephaeus nilssonii]|uniref:Bone marrow stromal antigen 2 n=1 Tax=Cnephaeus nilssonii TaxID=3371016 RepID=A0AA40I3U4_CNENI|nr:hypothetical protein QTO34_015293 [Eptesicus nilssonii]KAK1342533.1 hypothetical protein QTO34_015298 [Eptesicus nilssonii]
MASTLHYTALVPMDEYLKNLGGRKLPGWVKIVGILLGLLVVGLFVTVSVFANKDNSPACKNDLQAEQECRNITHLLEQLTQAQDILRETEAQAAICNQTVETLKISLEEEKAGGHKQQELVQKLQEEIKSLNQPLQEKSAELEQLRKETETMVSAKCPPNSGISLRLSVVPVLLTLSLQALLA